MHARKGGGEWRGMGESRVDCASGLKGDGTGRMELMNRSAGFCVLMAWFGMGMGIDWTWEGLRVGA